MKEINDIDLLFRSTMADAEEEVPTRIWTSISESLDKQEKKAAPVIFWRRTAFALAAAAAIAAIFILGPWGATESGIQPVDSLAEVTIDDRIDVEGIPSSATVETISTNPTVSISKKQAAETIETVVEEAIAVEQEGTAEQKEVKEQEYSRKSGNRSRYVHDKSGWDDYYDSYGTAPKAQKRPSLYFSGNMNSNGSPKAANNQVFRGLPAEGAVVKTIEQTSKESNYSIPFTVGLGVRIPIKDKFSIGTGVNYTLLGRSFIGVYTEVKNGSTGARVNGKIKNELHYVGIPVNLYYELFDSQLVDVYSFAGIGLEKGISNVFTIQNKTGRYKVSEKIKGIQPSVSVGLGMRFSLHNQLDLYLDPGIAYYFKCNQPTSIRTQQPLTMTFSVGLKYNI